MNLELGLDLQPQGEKPYSISDVMEGVKGWVQKLRDVWVEGEVSGYKAHRSGHWYFTLKDKRACMDCVLWADDVRRLRTSLQDGLKVYAQGQFTVYTGQGRLQFRVRQVLPTTAEGFHAAKFEAAKQALLKDGLLDPSRKRELPRFPRAVGVLTSPDGAAWHDIKSVVARRWPFCELVLVAATVQGDDAPRDIRRALALAARYPGLDVLIVGRGGGSKEDLWAFNDEAVARAVADSPVPTISAVGHEVDITLVDLVADLRAATPSAAAEKAVPDREDMEHRLLGLGARVANAARRPFLAASGRLDRAGLRMASACTARVERARATAERCAASLEALSPLKVLARGYSVARDERGMVLKKVADFPPGQLFTLRVTDGSITAMTEDR